MHVDVDDRLPSERPFLKADQIYWMVREDIVRLRMAPGSPILEKELSARYGVSRTPIREALKRLVDEDLVEVYPHSGTYVSRISFSSAEEGFVIRRALEIEGVRRAAARATDRDIVRLDALIVEMRTILRREALEDYLGVDDALHSAIAEISGCPRLWRFINLAKVHLDRLRQQSAPIAGHLATVTEQHDAIVRAIELRNCDHAELAMRIHLDSSFAVMTRMHKSRDLASNVGDGRQQKV